MASLAITAPLNDGETPTSFASRLAQANGRDRVRDFALDIGLDFSGVVAGRPEALAHLASLGRCSSVVLTSWAAVAVDDRHFLRGEDFGWRTLRRSRVFGCPSCLLSDLEDETLDVEVRQWGRAIWQVGALRTCRIHGQALVEIAHVADPGSLHDFAALALERVDNLNELCSNSVHRSPSDFETYIQTRLEIGKQGHDFTDALPLEAVIRLSENLGALLTFGHKVRLEDLKEPDFHEAGACGFQVLSSGEAGIRRALGTLQRTFFDSGSDWGPRAMFGRLYEWLAYENDDPTYDQVRDIIERHVIETMPIGPGETIFNGEVPVRHIHSLRSASIEYRLHPKRLRTVLRGAGLIEPGDDNKTDERVLFNVESVQGHLATLADSLSLVKAGQYLNAPRPHEQLLYNAGFIKPVVKGGTGILKNHAILRSDLDRFLSSLAASARPEVTGGFTIPAAARRANCSAMEIVRLLLDGQLAKVGLDKGSRGYLSILVDVDEVKVLVRRDEHGGLSLRAIEKRMSWSTKVVTALIEQGFLPSAMALNPVNRCPQRIVTAADVDAFDRSFVSLQSLAKERGVHFRKLMTELTTAGIEPDPAFTDVPATFYRRAEIQRVSATL